MAIYASVAFKIRSKSTEKKLPKTKKFALDHELPPTIIEMDADISHLIQCRNRPCSDRCDDLNSCVKLLIQQFKVGLPLGHMKPMCTTTRRPARLSTHAKLHAKV